jgi:hypothetical protein
MVQGGLGHGVIQVLCHSLVQGMASAETIEYFQKAIAYDGYCTKGRIELKRERLVHGNI